MPPSKGQSYALEKKLIEARTKSFTILAANEGKTSFGHAGYRAREDVTTLPPGIMVQGSYNVLTNTSGRIGNRMGYTLDGQTSTAISPILSSFDWETHAGNTRNLRAGGIVTGTDGYLQFRYQATVGDKLNGVTLTANQVVWIPIQSNQSSVAYNFAPIWNVSTQQQYLLFVNGGMKINEWSGGVGTIAATSNATGVISDLAVVSGGSGYKVGDIVTIGGSGTGATALVANLNSGGIVTYTLTSGGGAGLHSPGYQVGDTVTVASSTSSATFTVATVTGTAIATLTPVTQGFNYQATATYNLAGGQGFGAQITVNTVSANSVAGLSLLTPGTGYTATTPVATTGGTGTGLTVNIFSVMQGFIQLTGTNTAALQNFYYNAGNVTINNNTYQYNQAVGLYLIGINTNPTGEPAQSVVFQQPISVSNSAMTNAPINSYSNDLLGVLNNQIYLGCLTNNSVYVSKNTNYYSFAFTSAGRLPGEGAVITLDVPPVAFQPQEGAMYISGAKDVWYNTVFTLSADLKTENLTVQRLNTTANQGSQSQALTTKMKNDVVFLSFEPIINSFGRVDQVVLTPQMTDLSNPIINDMVQYNFTDGSITYFQNYLYIAVPKNGVVLVYNMTEPKNPYWEAPQLLPISRFSIINGLLYGHSYQSPVTYQLFNGWSDNGYAMQAQAAFSYDQLGVRTMKKNFNALYTEGYIASNTALTVGINYEYNGIGGNATKTILGTDYTQVEQTANDNSLGKFSLGKAPLGGDLNIQSTLLPPKFHSIKTLPRTNFYEYQHYFYSDGINLQWQLTAFGSNINISTDLPTEITE